MEMDKKKMFIQSTAFILPVFTGITVLFSFTGCGLQTQTIKDSDQIKQSAKIKTKEKIMKKAYYLDLMETTLSAYSMEHINRYFNHHFDFGVVCNYRSILLRSRIPRFISNRNFVEEI